MKWPSLLTRAEAQAKPAAGITDRLLALANRTITGLSTAIHVKMANKWRDQFNPLRQLTITRAVALLEAGERGEFADLEWLYRFIEKRDATLNGLIGRYEGGLLKLDWEIKQVPEEQLPEGATVAQAEAQAKSLREIYDNIENLRAAQQFLALARFRGYSHLEKILTNDGDLVELRPVPQWYWVRDGLNGDWQYNREARSGTYKGEDVPLEKFIIRDWDRPVNELGLINFVFKNMGKKDWAGFVETYGIPPIFLIGPPNVSKTDEPAYQETAEKIIGDSRGYLPNGSDVKTADAGARGVNPFKEFKRDLEEEVVLAGTGGKLTMLTESGSGTLAGGAHQDAWEDIIAAEAYLQSEVFQQQIDKPHLTEKFPGQPVLAYFELCAREETDSGEVVDEIQKLSSSGYKVDPAQVEEKTGYKLTEPEAPASPTSTESMPSNRDDAPEAEKETLRNRNARPALNPQPFKDAVTPDLAQLKQQIGDEMAAIALLEDEALMQARLRLLKNRIEKWRTAYELSPPGVDELHNLLATAWANGTAEGGTQS